ncbi:hypothetical protein SGLAM104S_05388 [Streptomyces glaucescens]
MPLRKFTDQSESRVSPPVSVTVTSRTASVYFG